MIRMRTVKDAGSRLLILASVSVALTAFIDYLDIGPKKVDVERVQALETCIVMLTTPDDLTSKFISEECKYVLGNELSAQYQKILDY